MEPDRSQRRGFFNPVPSDYDVRRTAAFALTRAYRSLRGLMSEDRFELGLYETRDLVLLEIGRLDGHGTPQQVARSLGMTPSSLSTVLKRTERAGYAERERDPGDRRRWRLRLTDTGRPSAQMAASMWRDADRAALRALSPEELRTLADLLERVRGAWVGATVRYPGTRPYRPGWRASRGEDDLINYAFAGLDPDDI